jgi:hypothetical protein
MTPDLLVLYRTVFAIYGTAIAIGIGVAILAAWQGHTAESHQLAEDVGAALSSLGKHAPLAEQIYGIKAPSAAPRLSRALQHGDPLNLWRLADLGPDFWLAFCARVAARYGAVVFTPQQVELLRGAGRAKRMAHMGIAKDAERKRA